MLFYFLTGHHFDFPLWTGNLHFELAISTLNWRLPLWTGDRHFEQAIATLDRRLPLWTGDRHFELEIGTFNRQSTLWIGDRHFEMAIATLQLAIATFNRRSTLWTGDHYFEQVTTTLNRRLPLNRVPRVYSAFKMAAGCGVDPVLRWRNTPWIVEYFVMRHTSIVFATLNLNFCVYMEPLGPYIW